MKKKIVCPSEIVFENGHNVYFKKDGRVFRAKKGNSKNSFRTLRRTRLIVEDSVREVFVEDLENINEVWAEKLLNKVFCEGVKN